MSEPSVATIKRLFAVSGNRCAFPRCTNTLIHTATGKVTGRICHIKARKLGGPRYDPNQTDDERNTFENLVLMCPIHHDVIDSDLDSYTVERLQEIKARHEATNAGGSEPTDEIARQLLGNIESDIAIVLNADAYGKIHWAGDVLHGGTKIVIDQAAMLDTQEASRTLDLEKLIRDIQSALYDHNSRLPYVLTLCLDLCDRTGLSKKYSRWLARELNGYKNYQEFPNEFDNQKQFEDWMRNWASHRLIKPYVKAVHYSPERMRSEVQELLIDRLLVAFPIAQIARDIQTARDGGFNEFSIPLLKLGQEHFAKLQSVVAEVSPGSVVPPDLQVFYTVADLQQVLDGVRNIVLSLLKDARSQPA